MDWWGIIAAQMNRFVCPLVFQSFVCISLFIWDIHIISIIFVVAKLCLLFVYLRLFYRFWVSNFFNLCNIWILICKWHKNVSDRQTNHIQTQINSSHESNTFEFIPIYNCLIYFRHWSSVIEYFIYFVVAKCCEFMQKIQSFNCSVVANFCRFALKLYE